MKKRVYKNRSSVLKAKPVYLAVTDAPPLPPLPFGSPLIYWRLPPFESVNEIIYLPPRGRAALMRESRELGYSTGLGYAEKLNLPMGYQPRNRQHILRLSNPITRYPLFCFARIFRADGIRRDIYNLAIKSFIDGCTDAGLWEDDSERFHTDFWIHFEGRGAYSGVELSFYETAKKDLL